MVEPGSAAGTHRRDLTDLAPLTGLRGVAVVAIIVFHAGLSPLRGGFLAVSTFFTLSGFLITARLLGEHDREGTIRLGRFWARRSRRLLPASVVTVTGVVIAAALFTDASRLGPVRGDAIAAVLGVANWRLIASGATYGAIFSDVSPTQHFWSLAIEMQFYAVYPLILIALLWVSRGNRRVVATGLSLLLAASLAAGVWLLHTGATIDRLYFGTDVRAGELLVGALLAVWWRGHRELGAVGDRLVNVAGAAAAIGVGATWFIVVRDDPHLYQGGLVLFAVANALVILAAAQPGGPVRAVLGWRPLVHIGVVSYAAYLFHWPIFVFTRSRFELSPSTTVLVGLPLAVGMATLSHTFLERPAIVGTARRARLVIAAPIAILAVFALMLGTGTVVSGSGPTSYDAAAGSLVSDAGGLGAAPDPGAAPAGTTPLSSLRETMPDRPLRVLVMGDSTAVAFTPLLDGWGRQSSAWRAATYARIGCGVGRGGVHARYTWEQPVPAECDAWPTDWQAEIALVKPDIVVMSSGFWDATDRKLAGESMWRAPGDTSYDDYLRSEYGLAADVLTATGAVLAWVDNPPVQFASDLPNPEQYGVNDPARMVRLNELLTDIAATRPLVRIIPFTAFLTASPGGVFDRKLRPDGLHVDAVDDDGVGDWLGPHVLDAYWSARRQ
jgi:peptidoglycan/LPS O-acetylase OafA/YrhL